MNISYDMPSLGSRRGVCPFPHFELICTTLDPPATNSGTPYPLTTSIHVSPADCAAPRRPVSLPNVLFLPEPTTVLVKDGNGRVEGLRHEDGRGEFLSGEGAVDEQNREAVTKDEAKAAHAAAVLRAEGGSEDREYGEEDDDDGTQVYHRSERLGLRKQQMDEDYTRWHGQGMLPF
ncbi:hypothetical protein VKT23_002861 [Stygiomarasmius scandens]|uniref:Uncharacterized protein n=1 Tax=Marasmiellus scandens TaxID=2682957 RepID=A0ABR1JVH0_9AGAR